MIKAKLIQHSNINIIKQAGVVAYRTQSKKTVEEYVKMLIKSGHESVLEHCFYTFEIICDRAMSHEIVRHRIASYTQESTRYVDFTKKDVAFNFPKEIKEFSFDRIEALTLSIMDVYKELKETYGTDVARCVLPNMTQTKIIMTINARSLRNFFKLRSAKNAHKDMRDLAYDMYLSLPIEHLVLFVDVFGLEE